MEKREIPEATERVPLEVYDRRLPVYRAFHRFVLAVLRDAKVQGEELDLFLKDTHDALFLFGETIEVYLNTIFTRAVELRAQERTAANVARLSETEWAEVRNKMTDSLLWFSEQLQNGKATFYPYLKI